MYCTMARLCRIPNIQRLSYILIGCIFNAIVQILLSNQWRNIQGMTAFTRAAVWYPHWNAFRYRESTEHREQQSGPPKDNHWLDGNRQNISSCIFLISEKSVMLAMKSSASEEAKYWDDSSSSWAVPPLSFKSPADMMSLNSPSKLGKALLTARFRSSSSLRFVPWLLFLNLNKLPSSSSNRLSCSLKIFQLSRKIARMEFRARWILLSRKPCWMEWVRTRRRDSRRILWHINVKYTQR